MVTEYGCAVVQSATSEQSRHWPTHNKIRTHTHTHNNNGWHDSTSSTHCEYKEVIPPPLTITGDIHGTDIYRLEHAASSILPSPSPLLVTTQSIEQKKWRDDGESDPSSMYRTDEKRIEKLFGIRHIVRTFFIWRLRLAVLNIFAGSFFDLISFVGTLIWFLSSSLRCRIDFYWFLI